MEDNNTQQTPPENGGQEGQQAETTAGDNGNLINPAQNQPKQDDGNLIDPGKPEDADKAPEQYEAFKLPEGYSLEGDRLAEVQGLFKGMNLSQEKAQSLIDWYVKSQDGMKAASDEAIARQVSAWKKQVRSSPSFEAERVNVMKGLRAVAVTPEEKALFQDSQLANHPAMWSMLNRIGRMVGEDNIGRGGGSASPDDGRFHVDMETL